jgi:hypothetical protein
MAEDAAQERRGHMNARWPACLLGLATTLLSPYARGESTRVLPQAVQPRFEQFTQTVNRNEMLRTSVRVSSVSISPHSVQIQLRAVAENHLDCTTLRLEDPQEIPLTLRARWFSVQLLPAGCAIDEQFERDLVRALDDCFPEDPYVIAAGAALLAGPGTTYGPTCLALMAVAVAAIGAMGIGFVLRARPATSGPVDSTRQSREGDAASDP